MIGNEEDFTACLGFEVEGADEHLTKIETDSFKKMIQAAVAAFPNFKVAATTLRKATTATLNDWSALYYNGDLYQSMKRDNLEIYDRVGGGDGFGLLDWPTASSKAKDPRPPWNMAARAAALAMTTPGDTSMVRVEEVEAAMKGKGARVIR